MAIHSLLRIAMDMHQCMGLQVDTVVPPAAMDLLLVAMVQPAQRMGQQVMHLAQTMQFTGRPVPLCMGQILPAPSLNPHQIWAMPLELIGSNPLHSLSFFMKS